LQWERVLPEVEKLGISAEVRRKLFHDNAARAFKLAD
jgi:predicted TIM-barrel fold metal-dependent hydrolase